MKLYAAKPRCHCCNRWWNWAGEARVAGKLDAQAGLQDYFEELQELLDELEAEI
jgi:hypothetical protein